MCAQRGASAPIQPKLLSADADEEPDPSNYPRHKTNETRDYEGRDEQCSHEKVVGRY